MTLDLPLADAPSAILAALQTRGRQWRESALPAELRDAGFYGVRVAVEGSAFRIWAAGGPRNPYYPVCVGTVERRPGGGSRLRAATRPSWPSVLAISAFALVCLAAGVQGGGFGVELFGALGAAVMYVVGYARAEPWRAALLEVVRDAVGGGAAPTGATSAVRSAPATPHPVPRG